MLDSEKLTQVRPEKKQVPLQGLYLGQRLDEMSVNIERTLVIADFLTDKNGVAAKEGEHHSFQVPLELKNTADWRLFQDLMAQADVIISGGPYFKILAALGNGAQDILYRFQMGREFERLGEWRLCAGYKKGSPDLAVVARNFDFEIPEEVPRRGRQIVIFTIDDLRWFATLTSRRQAPALTSMPHS